MVPSLHSLAGTFCTWFSSSPGPPAAGCLSISAHTGPKQKRKQCTEQTAPASTHRKDCTMLFIDGTGYLHSSCSTKTPEHWSSGGPTVQSRPESPQVLIALHRSNLITARMQLVTESLPDPTSAPPLAQHSKPAGSQDPSTLLGHLRRQVAARCCCCQDDLSGLDSGNGARML